MRGTTFRTLAPLLFLAAFGCGDADDRSDSTARTTDQPPTVVEPAGPLAQERAAPYSGATIDRARDALVVDFLVGVAPCGQLSRVDIAGATDALVVTVVLGDDIGENPTACDGAPLVGRPARAVVPLERPVDETTEVRDGAV